MAGVVAVTFEAFKDVETVFIAVGSRDFSRIAGAYARAAQEQQNVIRCRAPGELLQEFRVFCTARIQRPLNRKMLPVRQVSLADPVAFRLCAYVDQLDMGIRFQQRERIGTLRRPGRDEPTVAEHHPAGTHAWSADAPIAPEWFPYNRCDVWRCSACGRGFLRYTEYGGYYQDDRIRVLDPALVVDVPAP